MPKITQKQDCHFIYMGEREDTNTRESGDDDGDNDNISYLKFTDF